MFRVSGAVASSVCLKPPHKTQNEETDTEESSEITSLKLELDITKKLYEKALSQLVEMRLAADLRERTPIVEEVREEVREEVLYDESEIEDPIVDEPCVEDPVVEETVEEAVEVPPVFEGKLNINTATAHEISLALGCNITYAYCITGYRNKNGKFVSLDEVDDIKYLSKPIREKVKSRFVIDDEEEVVESESEEEVSEEEVSEESTVVDSNYKLNINSASLRELMKVGFTKRVSALIIGNRKKFGNFKSVEDLREIPEISNKTLRKLKDVLFVG
jgi:competence protein ComEA